jgi:site-specific recombinase XerD
MTTSRRRLGRSPDKRKPAMQLAMVQELYLLHHSARGHSPKTIRHYQDTFRLLERFIKETNKVSTISLLTSSVMNEFALWLRNTPTRGWRGETKRTEAGIRGTLTDLRAFVRWCHEEGHIESLPKVPVNKLPQVFYPILSDEELDTIFSTKQLSLETEIGTRNRALVAFMLDTGVRRAEVASLALEHLDVQEGQARIIGKGQKERLVFFAPSTAEVMKRWLKIRGDEAGSLFWLSFEGIKMVFNRIKREAGLNVFHPHQLRHTTATNLLAAGADTHSVRRMLGHASVLTTEKYLSMGAADLKAKHASASPYERVNARQEPTPIRGRRRLKSA